MKNFRLRLTFAAAATLTVLAPRARAQGASATEQQATHVVKTGDTLWDLAASYLGDAYLWPEIYRLNTDQIEDPHWIYPGEVLRLPGRARSVAAAGPVARPAAGPSVFARPPLVVARPSAERRAVQARVALGDIMRAPYFDREHGPQSVGRILNGADIPGIERRTAQTNFQLYDKVLAEPAGGALMADGQRFLAYDLGADVQDVGTVVVPAAVLQVVRGSRNGEAATLEVRELYGMLNSGTRLIRLDTAGAGVAGRPAALAAGTGQTGTIRAIHRPVVLPSLDYFVLTDLGVRQGLHVGDEVEIFHARQPARLDDGGLASPEVSIATGQIVRVTPFGSTARITSQQQPAIREGEGVRVVARMP